jgi:hypothetical protein
MFGVEDSDVLTFDILQSVDDRSLESLQVFFGCGFAGHVGVW